MATLSSNPPRGLTERRVQTLMAVASDRGVGLPLEDLRSLLPRGANPPSISDGDLTAWVDRYPELGRIVDGVAYPDGVEPIPGLFADRKARGREYLALAEHLVHRDLRVIHPLFRCVGVTGSTAYGEPEGGDDLDFLVVTRAGAVWISLLFTFVRLRLRGHGKTAIGYPQPCFNYVLDETAALREFGTPRGFLFAREALSTRIVQGESYYRALLGSTPWLEIEAPRMFSIWARDGWPPPPARLPAPRAVRWLDRLLYPLLAAYQQAGALIQNHRLRAAGREAECFRVVTQLGRFTVRSDKYGRLLDLYADASVLSPESVPTGRASLRVGERQGA